MIAEPYRKAPKRKYGKASKPPARPRASTPSSQRRFKEAGIDTLVSSPYQAPRGFHYRHAFLLVVALLCLSALIYRLVYLQVLDNEYLQSQGKARAVRVVPLMAQRGLIMDRHGEPLAVSSPVNSVWINPTEADLQDPNWKKLASVLNLDPQETLQKIQQKQRKQFMYLKRHIPPAMAKKVESLDLAGVHLQTEYQRFYPAGEVAAHVLGTTNLDHHGIQGLELAFDESLAGKNGHYRVLKDGFGSKVEGYRDKKNPQSGQDLILSLDSRIQYLAYRELITAVKKHQAQGGSVVVLSPKSGEILAMANWPSYNPNLRHTQVDSRFRNRAVTDQFEPGSVIKAFSMANILASGQFTPETIIDTNPGWLRISGKVIKDVRNFGVLDLNRVIQKSSNVGIARLTLALPPESLYRTLHQVGFGSSTQSEFPGEAHGFLAPKVNPHPLVLSTLSFGYGLMVTPLQLARAYAILANEGKDCQVTFLKQNANIKKNSQQILPPDVAQAVNKMLQLTTAPGGTARRAEVPGYLVAGKTGTVRKVSQKGYMDDSHLALFAGFAPADDPQVVIVVVLDDPQGGQYYGGQVAAPVFSKIMFGALRMLNVPQQQQLLQ